MIRIPDRLPRSFFASTGLGTILSTAALAAMPSGASASHRDWDHDRDHDRGGSSHVEISVGDRSYERIPVTQVDRVWVEPVYRTVCDRQWVPAQYRNVIDRVWVPESKQCIVDRVWVPDCYEYRDVEVRGRWNHGIEKERVLVERAHYEDRNREVCVPAHFEDATRQELVCDAHWENVDRQELVSAGHWEERRVVVEPRHEEHSNARISLRFPF